MQLYSRAKINLCLKVLGQTKSLHLLESVVVSIDIYDTIFVNSRSDKKVTTKFFDLAQKSKVVQIEPTSNVVQNLLEYIVSKYDLCGFDIQIYKSIPTMAGLGGSSSNAGSILFALKQLYNLQFDYRDIVKFGSDIPYMIDGGLGVIRGFGEQVQHCECDKEYNVVILKNGKVSTKECFLRYDKLQQSVDAKHYSQTNVSNSNYINTNLIANAWQKGDISKLPTLATNDLINAANSINPSILADIDTLYNCGAVYANMSGSGAACFGIFADDLDTTNLLAKLSTNNEYVVLTKSKNFGTTIIES